MAEHHVAASDVPAEAVKLARRGFRSWGTPAICTGRGGTSGGSAIRLRSGITALRVEHDRCKENGLPNESKPVQVPLLKVRFNGFAMVVGTCYLMLAI